MRAHYLGWAAAAALVMVSGPWSPVARAGGIGAWGLVVGIAMVKAGLTVPQALDDAARLEGCSLLGRLWKSHHSHKVV